MCRTSKGMIRTHGLVFSGICQLVLAAVLYCGVPGAAAPPLALHPTNPHYFLFRGKPTVLITSAEHYGAVINSDFNFVRYLDELRRNGLNLTRIWAGPYFETGKSFSIVNNTLAPRPGRFLPPWQRSATPGAADSGNRFDLSQWNPAYFERLQNFLRQASARGVIVEINLFCPYYREDMWALSPLNSKNNVNGVGDVPRKEVLTMKHPDLVAIEDAMVRKIVSELQSFDNLYYEICNEPYFGGVTGDWQRHIAEVIASTENKLAVRHLISRNISNGSKKIEDKDPNVSIFNFHYARPPLAVQQNYALNAAIGENETGFDGCEDAVYRVEGWQFLVAGGSLYNNLDYSFTVGNENGDNLPQPPTPGGGSPALRDQLGILLRFFDSIDFLSMSPLNAGIKVLSADPASVHALAAAGREYVVYLDRGRVDKERKGMFIIDPAPRSVTVLLDLPAGVYGSSWLDTKTGSATEAELVSDGGQRSLHSPVFSSDIVLHIVRKNPR